MSQPTRQRSSSGFTIIELLIATTVFSLILVVITVGVISFSKAYYKGVTATSTQNAARTIMDDISQAVQFSGLNLKTSLPAVNGSEGFCVGNTRYSYLRGWQLEEGNFSSAMASQNQNRYVFVRDTPAGGCVDNATIAAQDLKDKAQAGKTADGTELLSPHMRVALAKPENVGGDPNLYRLTLRVVYGDADLLNNPTGTNATCKTGLAGNQFCAVSQLSTIIQKRVN